MIFFKPGGYKSGKVRQSTSSRSRSRGNSRSPSRKGSKKSGKKSRSPSPTKTKKDVDLLSPDAMSNGYYIAHNAPQFLQFRGFGWDSGTKGKKKKKGKGKKKKWILCWRLIYANWRKFYVMLHNQLRNRMSRFDALRYKWDRTPDKGSWINPVRYVVVIRLFLRVQLSWI